MAKCNVIVFERCHLVIGENVSEEAKSVKNQACFLPFAVQRLCFCGAICGLLPCKRLPFAGRKTVFCNPECLCFLCKKPIFRCFSNVKYCTFKPLDA